MREGTGYPSAAPTGLSSSGAPAIMADSGAGLSPVRAPPETLLSEPAPKHPPKSDFSPPRVSLGVTQSPKVRQQCLKKSKSLAKAQDRGSSRGGIQTQASRLYCPCVFSIPHLPWANRHHLGSPYSSWWFGSGEGLHFPTDGRKLLKIHGAHIIQSSDSLFLFPALPQKALYLCMRKGKKSPA